MGFWGPADWSLALWAESQGSLDGGKGQGQILSSFKLQVILQILARPHSRY